MEKKPGNSIYLGILISGIISILIPFTADSSEAVSFNSYQSQISENYKKSLWNMGENIREGDFYSYRICDSTIPETFILSHCYTINLTFVSLMESSNGSVWVVQGILTADDQERFLILQIDPVTFDVTTDKLNIDLARSMEKTIFSLSNYENKSLKIGNVWDSVDSYFTNDVSFEIKRNESIHLSFGVVETSVLGYDVITSSNHFINKDFAFPILSTVYSPNIIFPEPLELYNYELIEYSLFDAETDQIIHSVCLNKPELIFDGDFDDFFVNSKNFSNPFEALP